MLQYHRHSARSSSCMIQYNDGLGIILAMTGKLPPQASGLRLGESFTRSGMQRQTNSDRRPGQSHSLQWKLIPSPILDLLWIRLVVKLKDGERASVPLRLKGEMNLFLLFANCLFGALLEMFTHMSWMFFGCNA